MFRVAIDGAQLTPGPVVASDGAVLLREREAHSFGSSSNSSIPMSPGDMLDKQMSAPAETSVRKIREQLERILHSKSFEGVERLKSFFSFIVAETIEGRGDQLKEYVVGQYAFDKGDAFDPRNDPIVRVQARRLRARIARYYLEEGQADEIAIELPKGGYVPIFRRRDAPQPKRSIAATLVSRNSVVVLPLEDISQDSSLGFLCTAITQEIIGALTKVERLHVSLGARNRALGADETSLPAAGANAATIVGGSVQKLGEQLRITSQLIDASSGDFLWSQSFDVKAGDLDFTVQENVARTVSDKLQAGLSDTGWRMGSRQQPKNLAAYNLYQQARYNLDQRTEEGLLRAVELFDKVIAEDPQYALAYAGLANAYELLGHYGAIPPVEVWTKAPSYAGRAVLLDDQSSEAHTALAHVKSTQDWDWKGSEQEFRRALELDPRNSTAHHWYAMSCLSPMGRLDEALQEMQMANALDPVSSIISRDVAMVHYYRREYDSALEECDHTIALNPHFPPAYWTLGLVQEQRGEFDESIAALKRAIELSPRSPRMKGSLGRTLALSGMRKEAEAILADLQHLSQERYISPFEVASIHFALGQKEQGFDWLKKAYKDRCFELISIKVDPQFDVLKTDPMFVELAGRLGLS
jgi:serine/threonine-protein kinase